MPTPPEPPQDPEFFRFYAENEVALHTYVRSLLTTREDAAEVMQQVMIALRERRHNSSYGADKQQFFAKLGVA